MWNLFNSNRDNLKRKLMQHYCCSTDEMAIPPGSADGCDHPLSDG